MTEASRMLFGIDKFEFSRESLAAVGRLNAGKQGFSMAIFHGALDRRNMVTGLSFLDGDFVEEYVGRLQSQSKVSLDKAKNALIKSGIRKRIASSRPVSTASVGPLPEAFLPSLRHLRREGALRF